MIGQQFTRLTVIGQSAPVSGQRRWLVRCNCGKEKTAAGSDLRKGRVKSCGCLNQELRIERNTKHGHATRGNRHPLYWIWQSMIRRCSDPNHKDWHLYGGRGIAVSEAWRSNFVTFLADMGERPTDRHQIDRKNNNGNYEAGNCRWVTPSENCLNRRPRSR